MALQKHFFTQRYKLQSNYLKLFIIEIILQNW